ncbi:component of SufBCD complex [Aliiroseovarius sp. YM-037]|uniref:component of SufBCD complex n=1 Tax=Aliiroseovarius sp. YM-037 TaxID=3341728 RepID=UPI003A7FE2A9
MDWYQTVFELIDMRSFSNLWFWIALAVLWSSTSHWVLGVPYDLVLRARRNGGEAMADLEDMVRINTSRMIYIANVSGVWLMAFGFFVLTSLALLGFHYRVEFAQAVFLLLFPMSFVAMLSLQTARAFVRDEPTGEDLCKRMYNHRLWTQLIGMISIFVTAMWGMYQNVTFGVLGG